ncbi:Hypothetical_protein [Hexamita inflata]|uniref:Hypothetical_protein n=1 Tax=Hexamita inflata TaxID=28002 RepID=A0ABP1HGZ9_9EUKA
MFIEKVVNPNIIFELTVHLSQHCHYIQILKNRRQIRHKSGIVNFLGQDFEKTAKPLGRFVKGFIDDMVVITTPFNTTPDKIQQTINETIDLYKEMHLEVNTEKCECTHPTSLFICVDRAVYMTYVIIIYFRETHDSYIISLDNHGCYDINVILVELLLIFKIIFLTFYQLYF